MNYDFDMVIDRRGTGSIKWDFLEKFFKSKDVLPMWVADMDFQSPQPVIEALQRTAEHGVFGYKGVPTSYCESVIGWMKRHHNWDIHEDWMVQTPGVVPAIYLAVTAFTDPGDKIIVQPPVYFPFFNAIKCGKREVVENPLILENNQYHMDFADLEKKINPNTKMIILCNPHNPVSRVWPSKDIERLGEICIRNNILVISDEIHQDIVYNSFKHVPFASISERFMANSIICTSASKTFNLPGLQTANIIIPNSDLRTRFKEALRGSGFGSPNIFGISATEAAYNFGEEWLAQLLPYLQSNIEFLRDYVNNKIPGLKVVQPEGTYLLWLDFRACGIEADKLGNFIREDAKVGLEPGIIFGCKENGFERMNIACPRSILEDALGRIERTVELLSNA